MFVWGFLWGEESYWKCKTNSFFSSLFVHITGINRHYEPSSAFEGSPPLQQKVAYFTSFAFFLSRCFLPEHDLWSHLFRSFHRLDRSFSRLSSSRWSSTLQFLETLLYFLDRTARGHRLTLWISRSPWLEFLLFELELSSKQSLKLLAIDGTHQPPKSAHLIVEHSPKELSFRLSN